MEQPMSGIVLYGAEWCGDCRRARTFLAANDIDYRYVDLAEEPDQFEEVIRRNNGLRSIPVIVFSDGSHLSEPTNDQLKVKLGI